MRAQVLVTTTGWGSYQSSSLVQSKFLRKVNLRLSNLENTTFPNMMITLAESKPKVWFDTLKFCY